MSDHHDLLDATYNRLGVTGPEFDGWLSNHGPMAADALIRLGCAEEVENWVGDYARRLHEAPSSRWPIDPEQWREVLGDSSRLGDWCELFDREVSEQPWPTVLATWWPRLIDGAVASATHGLIRTGHAVRALREHPTRPRIDELARALGYWAARHQRLPTHGRPGGTARPAAALEAVPALKATGGIRTRLDDLAHAAQWPATVGRLQPSPPTRAIPAALNDLVDAAVTHYLRRGHGNPVMLVHAATAPRAASLVLPVLPEHLWIQTYEAAWATTAAIASIYRPTDQAPASSPVPTRADQDPHAIAEATALALQTRDEHAIKFTEVALESHQRSNPDALPAALRAARLIGAP